MNQCRYCGQPEPPATVWQKWFWRSIGVCFVTACITVTGIAVVTLVQQITHG